MFSLNLPSIEANIKKEGEKTLIFDSLRKRFVALTPEEWVRQHFVNYLSGHKGYPTSLMANEISITLNGMVRRCDTVVYNRSLEPLVIIEYKAPTIDISQNTFGQAMAYNRVLRVPYIIISNGLKHYCCHLDYTEMKAEFLADIPPYPDLQP
ncbi:MAG: type I restriction enzyme HsdR N-terminal domain-containing protein [Bacteroidaceae bacterium]|nr:type I restriction enzyme HsdR N-terminal domain-containing protein [Bacteroidaceae bacterium]